MKKLKSLSLVLICFLSIQTLFAQDEIPISTTTLVGCGGFLVDTGLSAGDYSNNESFIMTLCAEDPETIINLYFNLFDLGEGDSMTIYDGPDDTAPLMGVYTGLDILNQDITSTIDGCLTLVWETDGSDVGNFTAEISCGLPCTKPFVLADIDQEAPYRICVGEELTFDATPTIFAEETGLGTFTWIFGDDTENDADWPIVTHSYDVPGAYIVNLSVIDDNDCQSSNVLDVLVEVSTTPSFTIGETTDFCVGEEVVVTGGAIPTFWDGSFGGISGGELFIPDDQSTCFESTISFGGFPPGSVIDEVGDFDNFFINFEHSFMGDLTISFECPDGNVITVHAQGGGGTFLGEPIDIDSDLTPGEGYDYWWSPDSTNDTWENEAGFGTLASDTYDSWQSWDALLGCSLNGDWTITICDSWGSDNGYIFDWSLEFDESFYEDDLSFTPSIGIDCDSTYWITEGMGEVLGTNCNEMTLPGDTDPGTYTYTFEAVDDFGCSYSSDFDINIYEAPDVNLGADIVACEADLVTIFGNIENEDATFSDLIFEWTPETDLSDGSVQNPNYTGGTGEAEFEVLVYPNGHPLCSSTDAISITVVETPDPSIVGIDEICSNETTVLMVDGTFNNYEWDNDSSLNGQSIDADPGVHFVTVYDLEGCEVTVQFEISALPVPVIDDQIECGFQVILADEPDFVGSWSDSGPGNLAYGVPTSNNTGVTATEYGTYTATFTDACGVQTPVSLSFLPAPSFTLEGEVFCITEEPGIITPIGPYSSFFDWEWNGAAGGSTIEFTVPGTYTYTASNQCGTDIGAAEFEAIVCEIVIPNIFTPSNGDIYNENFVVTGLEYFPGSKLLIFNRWGNEVFSDEDYSNDWSPTISEASEGTYYYVLELLNKDGDIDNHSGSFQILR